MDGAADEKELDLKEKYKQYCNDESNEAYTTLSKSQEEYDKQLLTLSTGLLAVLLAFLKDIVHLDSAVHTGLLYGGFLGLALTIVCVIASFQVSVYVLEEVREYWKIEYNKKEEDPETVFPDHLARRVKFVNLAGGICFIFGVVLVFLFITINISTRAGIGGNGEENSTRRSNPQTPDPRGCSSKGCEHQSADPACPEGEYCKFQTIEEIGIPVSDKKVRVNDGANVKVPQRKVGGTIPKKPINPGSACNNK